MLFVLPMGQVCEAQLFSKPAIPPGSAIPVLQPPQPGYIFPAKQTLTYIVDWRVFNAGRAVFHLEQQGDTEKISATADSLGGVNLDGGLPHGHGKDLVLVGSGASELEDMLSGVLKTQNRVISPDPEPEKGGFYRSDHISLSRVGVPMLDPAGSSDLVVGGKDAAKAIRDDYRDHHYHQPSDEFNPSWDITGVIDDLEALYTLGDTVANSDVWPNWYKDNEFRAIRDKSMAGAKK